MIQQILLDEVDKEKTAYTGLLGLLQFIVKAFGLSGAPATFQRQMDNFWSNFSFSTL